MFFKKIDLALFLPALLLTLIGSIALSSIAPSAYPLQFVYLGLSFLFFVIFANLDIRIIRSLGFVFYLLSIVLLGITFLFGAFSRGATRWIDLGLVTLQTSEIIKPLLLVFFASLLSKGYSSKRFFYAFLAFVIPFLLVFIQPDLGSALVLAAGFLGTLIMVGLSTRVIFLGLFFLLIALPSISGFLADYQKQRIFSFLDPQLHSQGSGYNLIQAKIAVGSGELFGRGLGLGTQAQLLFLPESHTDFILSSISEELGFVGSLLIVLCFVVILSRLVVLAGKIKDLFVLSLLGGIFLTIFSQSFINIGMNLGILPITGIPLPFVSSGGSALLSMSIILGIASSLSYSLKSSLR